MRVFEAEAGGGKLGDCPLEPGQLLFGVNRIFIGFGEMRVDAFHFNMALGLQSPAKFFCFLRGNAQPAHAAVDFDMRLQSAGQTAAGVQDLPGDGIVINAYADVQIHRYSDRVRRQCAQDQQRRVDAGGADFDSFRQIGDRQHIRAIGQRRPRNSRRAMPVGVGFDDRHQRDISADSRAYPADICGERIQVDPHAAWEVMLSVARLACASGRPFSAQVRAFVQFHLRQTWALERPGRAEPASAGSIAMVQRACPQIQRRLTGGGGAGPATSA